MSSRRFLIQLTTISVGVFIVLFILQFFPVFQASFKFALTSLGFFVGLSIIIFFAAKPAASSKDKNAFTRLILAFTLGKMVMVVALIIIFYRVLHLKGNYFLIPFFFIYTVFTVFEAYYLTLIGKVDNKSNGLNKDKTQIVSRRKQA